MFVNSPRGSVNEENLHEWVEGLGGDLNKGKGYKIRRIYVHILFFSFVHFFSLTCDPSRVRRAVQFEDQDQLERYHLNGTWSTCC